MNSNHGSQGGVVRVDENSNRTHRRASPFWGGIAAVGGSVVAAVLGCKVTVDDEKAQGTGQGSGDETSDAGGGSGGVTASSGSATKGTGTTGPAGTKNTGTATSSATDPTSGDPGTATATSGTTNPGTTTGGTGSTTEPDVPPPGPACVSPPDPGIITVDTSTTFQTFRAWEATLAANWGYTTTERDAVVAAAVGDMGLNRLRLEATGKEIENTNDDSDPNNIRAAGFSWTAFDEHVEDWVVPIKAAVEARGEPFFLNVCYVGFQGPNYQQTDAGAPAEYGEFALAVVSHLDTKYGLVPDQWEVRLEPDIGPTKVPGARLGELAKAASDRLVAGGYMNTRFGLPSTTDGGQAVKYLNQALAITGVEPIVGELTYHLYDKPDTADRNGIRDRAAQLGIETAQLEYMAAAEDAELYDDLTEANVSSWARFVLSGPSNWTPATSRLFSSEGNGTVTLASGARYIRQYMRAIRPGMTRVAATSSDGSVKPVAFRTPKGRVAVLARTSGPETLTFAGLPEGKYAVSYATSSEEKGTAADIDLCGGEALSASIPGAGVIAITPIFP